MISPANSVRKLSVASISSADTVKDGRLAFSTCINWYGIGIPLTMWYRSWLNYCYSPKIDNAIFPWKRIFTFIYVHTISPLNRQSLKKTERESHHPFYVFVMLFWISNIVLLQRFLIHTSSYKCSLLRMFIYMCMCINVEKD